MVIKKIPWKWRTFITLFTQWKVLRLVIKIIVGSLELELIWRIDLQIWLIISITYFNSTRIPTCRLLFNWLILILWASLHLQNKLRMSQMKNSKASHHMMRWQMILKREMKFLNNFVILDNLIHRGMRKVSLNRKLTPIWIRNLLSRSNLLSTMQ